LGNYSNIFWKLYFERNERGETKFPSRAQIRDSGDESISSKGKRRKPHKMKNFGTEERELGSNGES
jgi:hypothetical protein